MTEETNTGVGRRSFIEMSGAALGGIAVGATVTAAESTDRFIVEQRGSRSLDLDVVHEMPGVDIAVVRGSERDLKQSNAVKSFAPDTVLTLETPETPDSLADGDGFGDVPASRNDEDLYDLAWDKQSLSVEDAHEETKGAGTRTAVIDDGIFAGHPDLNVNERLSRNFSRDTNGPGALFDDHGTHVAGTIAAQDNDEGVLGTAPETELVDLRVFSGSGALFGSILAAITYAAAIDCDVANLSLGAYPIPRQGLGSFYGKALNRVMTFANSQGTLLVVAAGNDAADLQHDKNLVSLPNEGAQGLSVAATGPKGFRFGEPGPESPPETPAYYTNYGANAVTLGAPGGNLDFDALAAYANDELSLLELVGDWVLSTTFDPTGEPETADLDGDGEGDIVTNEPDERTPRYGYKQGTSMAAPQVAGAAALVKSANPGYNANQVRDALATAADVPDDEEKAYYGSGYLNVVDAL